MACSLAKPRLIVLQSAREIQRVKAYKQHNLNYPNLDYAKWVIELRAERRFRRF